MCVRGYVWIFARNAIACQTPPRASASTPTRLEMSVERETVPFTAYNDSRVDNLAAMLRRMIWMARKQTGDTFFEGARRDSRATVVAIRARRFIAARQPDRRG